MVLYSASPSLDRSLPFRTTKKVLNYSIFKHTKSHKNKDKHHSTLKYYKVGVSPLLQYSLINESIVKDGWIQRCLVPVAGGTRVLFVLRGRLCRGQRGCICGASRRLQLLIALLVFLNEVHQNSLVSNFLYQLLYHPIIKGQECGPTDFFLWEKRKLTFISLSRKTWAQKEDKTSSGFKTII